MDIMEPLVKNIASTQFESLPPEAILASKKGIADTIGVMIAGSSVEGCQILVDHLKEWGGVKESTIVVFGEKAPSMVMWPSSLNLPEPSCLIDYCTPKTIIQRSLIRW